MSNNLPSLKKALEKELTKTNIFSSGIEGATAAAQAISSVSENESNNIIKKPLKKGISNNLVGKTKMKTPVSKLTTGLPIMGEEQEMDEKWSEKYKKSIDCNNPKGFSQKAHCQGRKKENKEGMGASAAGGFEVPLFSETKQEMQEKCWNGYKEIGGKMKNGKMVPNCVKEGKEEYCDSCDRVKSKCICGETKKFEATEATGAYSSGQYSTTDTWAKSTSKKDWRGKSKTQIPGGKFVQVKKKCKKFPYCNQGDIKALKIFENEKVKNAIRNISQRHNISENVIKTIIAYEYENTFPKK